MRDFCGELREEIRIGGYHNNKSLFKMMTMMTMALHNNRDADDNPGRFSTLEDCVASCGGDRPQERAECHQVERSSLSLQLSLSSLSLSYFSLSSLSSQLSLIRFFNYEHFLSLDFYFFQVECDQREEQLSLARGCRPITKSLSSSSSSSSS